ncbi:hypothetical protein LTS18_008219, partial [Coniosporium uncinatum]
MKTQWPALLATAISRTTGLSQDKINIPDPILPPTIPPGTIGWPAAYAKASAALAKLSNKEKTGLITGTGWYAGPCVGHTTPAPSINFPSLCLQDGPLGVRYARGVTAFPAGVTTAQTWDKDLMYTRGLALGEEARALGVHVQLGPVGGPLGKSPYGGRNWEGFSPDP